MALLLNVIVSLQSLLMCRKSTKNDKTYVDYEKELMTLMKLISQIWSNCDGALVTSASKTSIIARYDEKNIM